MYEDTLAHYGILGMKWGVRRYQNPDGTLTEAGKKRYGSKERFEGQRESVAEKKRDARTRGALTNAQLRDKIERLKMERELRTLTTEELSPGKKFVDDVLKEVGKSYFKTVATGAALYGTKAAVAGEFNRKELAEAIFNGGPKKK